MLGAACFVKACLWVGRLLEQRRLNSRPIGQKRLTNMLHERRMIIASNACVAGKCAADILLMIAAILAARRAANSADDALIVPAMRLLMPC